MTVHRRIEHITADIYRAAIVGGGTIPTVVGVSLPPRGYIVGQKPYCLVIEAATQGMPELITNWVRTNLSRSMQPGYFLGVWEYRGSIYLDVVRVYSERLQAERDAAGQGELAIYSIEDQKVEMI